MTGMDSQRDATAMAVQGAGSAVTVVTVTYNSAHVVGQMLASVPPGVRMVVVDNASSDRERLRQVCHAHGASLVESARNAGFGSGCNVGAGASNTDWLLFLNPDAELAPGAIDRLMAATTRHPDAVAMNPRIVRRNGDTYFMRRSYLLPRSKWLPRGCPATDREVSVLCGAAMLVRSTAFERVGGFDPRIFLYHEDDDLSIRLAESGGRLMFIRDAVVHHGGGASSGDPASVAAFKAWHMGRSRIYGAMKHGRPFARARGVAHALVQLLSPVAIVSRRKRAKQWGYLMGCISAIRSRDRGEAPDGAARVTAGQGRA
jgi:GT2 family glycosyltransferase